jgi:hypothetical protein
MLDDVNEKIRRNLVVFSVACLAIKWLDLSVVKILSSQFFWLSGIEPGKLLLVAVLIQIYLLLRYRFSPSASRAWREMIVEVIRLIRGKVRYEIQYKVKNFKFFSKSPLFKPDLSAYIEREIADDTLGDGVRMTVRKMSAQSIKFASSWKGDFSCATLIDRADGQTIRKSGGYRLDFEFDIWSRVLIWMKATFHMLFYTRATVELFFPGFLGLASLVVLLLDFFQST